nr:zinc finger protein CONSTANS-LIKE 10-like [Tanacetum cinerariifolium]
MPAKDMDISRQVAESGGMGRGRGDASRNAPPKAWQQDGDWMCPNTSCMNVNFSFRGVCNGVGVVVALIPEFYEDFSMDEVDLSIENYKELFGEGHNDPKHLFAKDGIDSLFAARYSTCHGAYTAKESSTGHNSGAQPAYTNAASADSLRSCKTEPNPYYGRKYSNISFQISLGRARLVIIKTGASPMLLTGEPPWSTPAHDSTNPSGIRNDVVLCYKEKKKNRKFGQSNDNDPNRAVSATGSRGTDGRNFDVHNPFAFGAFGISELDELMEIIPKKKNTVGKGLDELSMLKEKVFATTTLKNKLRKLLGKNVVENVAPMPHATVITPGMFRLDLERLSPKLLQNKEAHIDYIKHTKEQAANLQEIVKHARELNPLDSQFCDSDSKVAFKKHTCFIHNLEGVDLLKGSSVCQSTVRNIRKTMEQSVNQTLRSYYEDVDISHETTVKQFPQLVTPKIVPCVASPVPVVTAPKPVDPTGTSFSTSIDQDAPSPSTSQTPQESTSPAIPPGVVKEFHNIEVTHLDNDPFFGLPILKLSSEESSSRDVIQTNVYSVNQPLEYISKWTKDNLLNNVISDPFKSVFTRHHLQTEAMFCYIDAFLTFVEPKNYKEALKESCWIEAIGIFFNQSKYALEIIKKYGMETSDLVDTLMVEKTKPDEDLQEKVFDPTRYRGMIGSLMYLTLGRLDLVFVVCMCARYQAKPTEKHLYSIKRIFQYLKGSINMGMWYSKDSYTALTAYADADHAGCQDTKRSTYGGMQLLAGSESRPPMLNKENNVPWSSRLLRYTKSRPNRKLIHNSIINGPYVRRMILEPGDTNREVPMNETFHVQTDDELTEKELKQVEADDQAIQTILLGLPENIYAAVDSCEMAQEIWFTSNERESIESYYHRFLKLMNDLKRNKHFPEKIASNLKFLNNLQPEWSRHVTIVHQNKDLHTADYTQLYDFLKYNQKEVAWKLLGSSGVSSGSSVEVVEWSGEWGRGGVAVGGKTGDIGIFGDGKVAIVGDLLYGIRLCGIPCRRANDLYDGLVIELYVGGYGVKAMNLF